MPWAFALEILAVLPSGCGGLQNNFRFWGKPLFTWFTWSKDASQQRVMQFLPSVETEQTITRPQTAQLRKRLSWWKKKLHLETKDNTGCINWLNCKREVARVRWQSWRGKTLRKTVCCSFSRTAFKPIALSSKSYDLSGWKVEKGGDTLVAI